MGRKRDLAGVLVGVCLGLAVGWLVFRGEMPSTPEWVGSQDGTDAALIIVVETQANLDMVRRAVSTDRVVASSSTGFAIEPQRVVVLSLESAGEILMMAGWQDRPLEIVDVGRQLDKDTAAAGKPTGIASLVNKPTLTRGEAYLLLSSM